jgi:hypothetical protein
VAARKRKEIVDVILIELPRTPPAFVGFDFDFQ